MQIDIHLQNNNDMKTKMITDPEMSMTSVLLADNVNSFEISNVTHQPSCRCPKDCNVFSYSPELSMAGLSLRVVEPYLIDGSVASQNVEAQEIANRVVGASLSDTITQMQNVLEAHSQIRCDSSSYNFYFYILF